ncbi:MAG: hypothetical protein HC888_15810 [Candidatus Competibacteraceae bacterium]|nr:hypothetical protein [Candidatus Competibacteraceae bacterium]
MSETNGRIYAPVKVNGNGPLRFLIDTGASGMGRVDSRLVRENDLPVVGVRENSDGVNVAQVDVVRLDSLELGELRRAEVQVLSRNYNTGRTASEFTWGNHWSRVFRRWASRIGLRHAYACISKWRSPASRRSRSYRIRRAFSHPSQHREAKVSGQPGYGFFAHHASAAFSAGESGNSWPIGGRRASSTC